MQVYDVHSNFETSSLTSLQKIQTDTRDDSKKRWGKYTQHRHTCKFLPLLKPLIEAAIAGDLAKFYSSDKCDPTSIGYNGNIHHL